MKLRNKKTGRIVNFRHIAFDEPKDDREKYEYSSLAEFNEEWEDVPAEPLIKDERIRKAVRAWADVNNIDKATCKEEIHCVTFETERGMFISFDNADPIPPEGTYTIPELCGEDEE